MTSVDLLYGLCGDKIHRVDALTTKLTGPGENENERSEQNG